MMFDVHKRSFAIRLPRTSLHVRTSRPARITVCKNRFECQEFRQAAVDLSVNAATYDVYAETRDGELAETRVTVSAGEEREVKLELLPPRIIQGVVSFDGAPVPGITVQYHEYVGIGKTDSEGRFSLRVPATLTRGTLSVSKENWMWFGPDQEVDVRGNAPIEIRLPEAPYLHITEGIP